MQRPHMETYGIQSPCSGQWDYRNYSNHTIQRELHHCCYCLIQSCATLCVPAEIYSWQRSQQVFVWFTSYGLYLSSNAAYAFSIRSFSSRNLPMVGYKQQEMQVTIVILLDMNDTLHVKSCQYALTLVCGFSLQLLWYDRRHFLTSWQRLELGEATSTTYVPPQLLLKLSYSSCHITLQSVNEKQNVYHWIHLKEIMVSILQKTKSVILCFLLQNSTDAQSQLHSQPSHRLIFDHLQYQYAKALLHTASNQKLECVTLAWE